jgi:tetratricopeptide (TPR) repeat protein
MIRDRIVFGMLGLVLGALIGFFYSNSVNRSGSIGTGIDASNAARPANLNLPPDHPPLGQSEQSSTSGALPQVNEAIEKARREPDNFEAQMTAGDLFYQIQRFDSAVEFYQKANRLRPNENEPLIKLGNANFDSERYLEAERFYTDVLKRTPDDVAVRTDLGLTFFLRSPRDVDRAIKEFNAALAVKPDSEMALQNLALAYKEKGDTAGLQRTLDRLERLNPDNPLVRQERPR